MFIIIIHTPVQTQTGFYPGSDALGDQHQLQFASTVPYLHCAVRKIFDILRAEYINQTLSEIDETITRRFHAILDILWPWAHGSTGLPSEVESIVSDNQNYYRFSFHQA